MHRVRRIVGVVFVLGALWVAALEPAVTAVASASRGPLVLNIPGLSAREIGVGAIARLDDGGAVVAASLTSGPGRGSARLAVVRLRVDGTVDLGYGTLGISTPPTGRNGRATAMAVNPATGEAWIGLARGHAAAGAIVAIDGLGRRVRGFGHQGLLTLTQGPPSALAWRSQQLLLAAGPKTCRGCTLALASASTGRLSMTRRLGATDVSGARTGCLGLSIAGMVFVPGGSALLSLGSAGRGCGAELALARPAQLLAGGAVLSVLTPFGPTASSSVIGALGSRLCLGGSGPGLTQFGPLTPGGTVKSSARGPAARLDGVVALGQSACAVLLETRAGGLVLQASAPQRNPTRDVIPRNIQPLGMFRCDQHLLVIGARRHRGTATGVVVVVAIRRGPHALMARSASMATTARSLATPAGPGSGCT